MLSPENGRTKSSVWIINSCVFDETCNGNFWTDKGSSFRAVRFSRQNEHGIEQITQSEGGLCLYKEGKVVGEISRIVTDTGALVMQISVVCDCPELMNQLEKTGWIRV